MSEFKAANEPADIKRVLHYGIILSKPPASCPPTYDTTPSEAIQRATHLAVQP